jgi:hypothetical protein
MDRSIESPITLRIKREAEEAKKLSQAIREQLNLLFYPGFIAMFPFYSADVENPIMMSINENWMLCDGRLLEIEEYPELYEVIGKKFGGSTTKFRIPYYGANTYLVGALQDSDLGYKGSTSISSTSTASVLNGGSVGCLKNDGSSCDISITFNPIPKTISFTDTRTTQLNRSGMYYYIKVR